MVWLVHAASRIVWRISSSCIGIMQALDLLAQLIGLRLDLAHALPLVEDAHDAWPDRCPRP